MTTSEEIALLRERLDELEAELAERPTDPLLMPIGTAEMVVNALHLSEGAPKRPVLVSPETFDAIQAYARNRITVQVGSDRSFTLVRDEAAPPFLAALAGALAETP